MKKHLQVLKAIDEINLKDPRKEMVEGDSIPKEYLYSLRMSEMLELYDPHASDLLRIATRGQHIKRWAIPRSSYSMDRKGYLKWRTQLKIMHGSLLAGIMQSHGYNNRDISQVVKMVTKAGLKTDKNTQALEDIACLVFLQYYFNNFTKLHPQEKILSILRKTWQKMSEKGKKIALKLSLPKTSQKLIMDALNLEP